MKAKKISALILAATTITLLSTACGKSETNSTASASSSPTASATTSAATETQTIKLGVVGSDKEIWIPAQQKLKKEGIDLELVEFSDYTTPNQALATGEIDLNAFQHQVYLDSEIASHKYKIQAIGYTLLAPLNLYSNKIKSMNELKDGDVIAIPNDATNEGRALKVLQEAGIITLKNNASSTPTIEDIASRKINIKIKELAADTITSALPDVTAAIINGNYAVDYGLTNDDAIYKDTGTGSKGYWNLIAARTKDLSNPGRVKLFRKVVEAYQQPATEKVFKTTFKGAYIKAGWDVDLLADYK